MTTQSSAVAYLGPEGSFCHQAARMLHTHADEFIPMKDVKSVVAAVECGEVRHGLVPIENSVEGEVTSTVHEIVFNTANVFVREEVVIPVSFHAYTNSPHAMPTTVVSHPFALAQCQNFISSSNLIVKSADSTSAACENLAKNPDSTVVALGSVLAGELYGLHIYKENVEDNTAAHTKFYLLSRSLPSQRTQDEYRTWIALVPPDNHTGVLADILQCFSSRGLAVFSISSRPLRTELGAYCFILTTESCTTLAPLCVCWVRFMRGRATESFRHWLVLTRHLPDQTQDSLSRCPISQETGKGRYGCGACGCHWGRTHRRFYL
jgi:prephenate dehydratase